MASGTGTPHNLYLIQLAGGRGVRAAGDNDDPPKQFRPTGQGLLFTVSLRAFLELDSQIRVAGVVVTAPAAWRDTAAEAMAGLGVPWTLAEAGSSRTASTASALEALQSGPEGFPATAGTDLVAIHDAARPFATAALMRSLAEAAAGTGAAVPGIPVADTVVESGQDGARYLDRSRLLGVQTPQVFAREAIVAAHLWAAESGREFTDDGGLMAERGLRPTVVAGEQTNWKVTTEGDWARARDLLAD